MRELDLGKIQGLIDIAVAEDFGMGDPTTLVTVAEDAVTETRIVSRDNIVVCGMALVGSVLGRYDENLQIDVLIEDGQSAKSGDVMGVISGPVRSMLSAERVVLNFLQRLCGISTVTNKYVEAVSGTNAKIYDTRKTTPGWRELEKYAVRCGGGENHRMHLGDGVLIKDNHIAEFGDELESKLTVMVGEAKKIEGVEFVGVEVDDIEFQLVGVLRVKGVDIVLLDNMTNDEMRQAVAMRNEAGGERPLLEASGNVRLDTVREAADTGVDRISIGALTHSAVSVDIGLDR